MRRHLHFSIASRYVTAAEITVRVGIEPDEIAVLGSLQDSPPLPPAHAWTISGQNAGLDPSEQLLRLLARLSPRMDAILDLCAELSTQDPLYGGASLEVEDYPQTTRIAAGPLATLLSDHTTRARHTLRAHPRP